MPAIEPGTLRPLFRRRHQNTPRDDRGDPGRLSPSDPAERHALAAPRGFLAYFSSAGVGPGSSARYADGRAQRANVMLWRTSPVGTDWSRWVSTGSVRPLGLPGRVRTAPDRHRLDFVPACPWRGATGSPGVRRGVPGTPGRPEVPGCVSPHREGPFLDREGLHDLGLGQAA